MTVGKRPETMLERRPLAEWRSQVTWQRFILTTSFGWFLLTASFAFGGDITVTLDPGEGTIIQIGRVKELASATSAYFALPPKPLAACKPGDEPYRLDFMPLGFYLGDVHSLEPALKAHGITDAWAWYDQLLKQLGQNGVNTIYIQGGGAISATQAFLTFTDFCAQRGFKLIVQPGDAYFGGGAYTGWEQRQKKVHGQDTPVDYDLFFRDYIKPACDLSLPKLRDARVWAWAPVEELPLELEKSYTPYKQLLRQYLPNHLLVQVDSQQARADVLKSKQPPIPDLFGFDRYCWWHQVNGIGADGKERWCLWTPHFASRWLYGALKDYFDATWKIYQHQAFATLQGPGWLSFKNAQAAARYGWQADENYRCATAPDVRYHPALDLWSTWGFYLPPANAERLSSWLAVCAGAKGIFIWGGLGDGPDGIDKKIAAGQINAGDAIGVGILHYDLTPTPQANELFATWKTLKRLEPVILAMQPSDTAFATCKDNLTFVNSFTDTAGRRFIVVVNGQIGQWNGNSPDWIQDAHSAFSIGIDGNLTGYTPMTTPRTLTLKVADGDEALDFRTIKQLAK